MVIVITPWTSLLLQDKPGLHEFHHALANVEQYYLRLQEAMKNESMRDQILLKPDQTHTRLVRSFDILRTKQLPGHIAEKIFEAMVVPFIDDHTFSREQTIQLVGSALPLLTQYPIKYLQNVACILLSGDLLENMVANESYTQMLKTWLLSKKSHLPVDLLKKLGDRLVAMCDQCSADHGTKSIAESWRTAFALKQSMSVLMDDSQKEELSNARSGNLPSLASMKVLTLDDKKTSTHKPPMKDFKIPDHIRHHLVGFNIPVPLSARGLSHAMDLVQTEIIPSLLRSALESFPCRICMDRLTKGSVSSTLSSKPAKSFHGLSEHVNAEDIFGKRAGIWKVLLSDIAFRNAQKIVRSGQFKPLERKLRDLASGHWKGKNLSQRVGSEKQKKRMKVPVLEASVSSTVSILWQIDVGFYDETPWVQQQIVKIWQIVGSKEEIGTALDQILVIQETYTPEISKLCSNPPVLQDDGTRLPQRYDNVKDTGFPRMNPINKSKATQTLIEMSTKFYNLTEPFLKALGDESDAEEFPFDLSPEELDIVKHFSTSSLILGRSGTGKTTCLLFKMLARHRARQSALKSTSDDQQIRQLLLTRSSYLASKLRAYSRSLIGIQQKPSSEDSGSDQDTGPTSFFALQSWQFPVVCTYSEFLDLLEHTIRMADRKNFLKDDSKDTFTQLPKNLGKDPKVKDKRVIDFSIFKTEYWGCLGGISPPACSAELLFAEIMGVIKGSGMTAKSLVPLSRADYVKKNPKASPAFSLEGEREKVFAAYERYEKQKKQRNEVDELDRVSDLLKYLKNDQTLAKQIQRCFEEIYVDEIQDLRCVDIILLFSCLSNARGIHLAGDTAQCISKDSVFCFPEIKALFYDHYGIAAKELNQPSIAKPVQFSLAKNYRSHQGILSFASWIMKLLWHGFPETIDKLEPEIGQVGGPLPVIFAGFDSSILSAKMIGLVKLNDRIADFGAEQVILVRDDASKDKLQTQIGEIALVLTILESKGMEFDDVLVYDFFGGSGLGSSYRCLFMLVQQGQNQFDSQKHAALCSELKSLYVAATRARKQLWFMEPHETSVNPVVQALSQGGVLELAELVKQKDPDVASKVKVLRAGGSVDPDRWVKKAAHFVARKSYAEALFCYKKGNDARGMDYAQACLHEQNGRSHRAAGRMNDFNMCYDQAIVLFLKLGLSSEAADCCEGLGRLDKAAEIWKDRGQFQKAASFYEKGRFFVEASDCYHSCRQYEDAIEVLRRGERFDEVVTYANRQQKYLSNATLSRYSRLCNILLKQGRVSTDLRAATINMLGTDTQKIEFFKEFEMWEQLRMLYGSKERWFEYYSLSVAMGDISEAMETLLSHGLIAVVERNTVEKLFHYAMAEAFFAKMGLTQKKPARDLLLMTAADLGWLKEVMEQWKTMFSLVDSFEDPEMPATVEPPKVEGDGKKIGLVKDDIKDFFSFCMMFFESSAPTLHTSIFARSRFELLPIRIIARVGHLLQHIDSKPVYFQRLALTCGIFINPQEENQAVVLHWSPLIKYAGSLIDSMPLENLSDLAKTFIKEHFTTAVTRLHDYALTFLSVEFPRTCVFHLARGYCGKSKIGDCTRGHEIPSEERAMAKISCLLNITELFARLTALHYSQALPQAFHGNFLSRRRRWVSETQAALILITSLEQSPTAIAVLRSTLQGNPEFPATASCLEELFMYRVQRQWDEISRGSFSSFLAIVQGIQALGPGPAIRCERALQDEIKKRMSGVEISRDPFATPQTGLNAAEKIRLAVERREVSALFNGVREYTQYLIAARDKSVFGSFHAVLHVLEYAVTYALCVANPDHGVVLPWSWAILHLPRVLHPDLKHPRFSPTEIRTHMSVLTTINNYFCMFLNQVNVALEEGVLNFHGDNRAFSWNVKREMSIIFKRRSTELLMTVIVNLDHWTHPPTDYSEMRMLARRALLANVPNRASLDFSTNDKFRQNCIRAYEPYNQKDQLRGILLNDQASAPSFLRPFMQDGVGFTTLGQVLTFAKVTANPSMGPGGSYQMATSEWISNVTKIQQWWRVAIKALTINRSKENTAEGRYTAQLVGLCNEVFSSLPAKRWQNNKKNHMRSVIFTDVFNLIITIATVSDRLRQLRGEWKREFDTDLSITETEALTAMHDEILVMEKVFSEATLDWGLNDIRHNMLVTSILKFKNAARKAQREIVAVNRDIGALLDQIAALGHNG